MRVFESPNAIPSRGMFRIAGRSLATTLRSLPGLLLLGLTWIGVAALVLLVVALPVGVSQALSPILAFVVGGMLALLALPFLVFWDAANLAASSTLLASRALDEPAGAVDSLGHGLRRALPFLGTVVLTKLLVAIVLLPLGFVGLATSFFWGMGSEGSQPIFVGLALILGLSLPILLFFVLHITARLGFAPMVSLFEGLGPVAALERAWSLTRDRVLRLLGYALIGLVLAGGFGFLAAGGGSRFGLMAPDYATATEIIGGQDPASWGKPGVFVLFLRALATLGLPVLVGTVLCFTIQTASVLLYFDLRRRHEGFGLAGGIGRDFRLDLEEGDGGADGELGRIDPSLPDFEEGAEGESESSIEAELEPVTEPVVLDDPDPAYEAEIEAEPEADIENPWTTVLARESGDSSPLGPGSERDRNSETSDGSVDAGGLAPQAVDAQRDVPVERTGDAARYDESGATRMHRLIEMLPEADPAPEADSRPGFVKRLLGWLPAPMPESPEIGAPPESVDTSGGAGAAEGPPVDPSEDPSSADDDRRL